MSENKLRILVAEDDQNLGAVLSSYLKAKSYDTVLCQNGEQALKAYSKESFDFLIIDVMMPVKDGFSLARDIRKIDASIPILFLTARSMQEDILEGFDAGADDYLTKPFSMEELLARISAILRRGRNTDDINPGHEITIGSYTFDYLRQTLVRNGKDQKLTSKENELLLLLCRNMNEVLDRTTALNIIWKDDSYFNARSMDVYVTKLRKYLRDDSSVEIINVHGVGFKLVIG